MKKLFLVVAAILFGSMAVRAQDAPRADISAGYSYLRQGFSDGVNSQGGSISGAGYFNHWLGLAGDFGVYHVSQSGISGNTYTYLFGPRFSAKRDKSVSPFAQVMVGGDHFSAGGGTVSGFSWSAGGGFDLALSHRIALRPQFDYIGLRYSDNTTNSVRASLSVVFRFGSL